MEKNDLISSILSKDATKVTEAKTALKEMLTARSANFRQDATKFLTKSIFESTVAGEKVISDGLPNGDGDHDADDVITVGTEPGHKSQPEKGIGDIGAVEDKDGLLAHAQSVLKGEKQ